MSKPYDGGPAFPWREEDGAGGYNQHVGMSLRDWFAGKALAGMPWSMEITAKEQAKECYAIADAMLAERLKGGGK